MDMGMTRGEGIWLDLPAVLDLTSGPPRRLYVFNPDTGAMDLVGGAGHGGSPLLAPGLPAPASVELLVLAGDPPDALTLGGDYLYLRAWAPTFLVTEGGDIITAEGMD
jgi:hypothetical protein